MASEREMRLELALLLCRATFAGEREALMC